MTKMSPFCDLYFFFSNLRSSQNKLQEKAHLLVSTLCHENSQRPLVGSSILLFVRQSNQFNTWDNRSDYHRQ